MASTSNSSSFSSSSMSRRSYDVFLSFRGPDTRHTIVSHLYNALHQKGVYTFKDNEELKAGQRRSELFYAIQGSRVAVVVFSENYASSKWCLDELQKIMECMQQGKLTALPIFYHVSPGEVRLHEKDNGEKGCYQKALEVMEAKYGKDSETVKRWREALWKGGDLIGKRLGQGQDEGIAARDVVTRVLELLNHVPLPVAKYPVAIDRHLRAIRPLLHIDPHDNDVYMVGLHGQGGAGKTTLSKAICNDIADRFDSWCFLENVRENTLSKGLAHLQQKLLCKLLSVKDLSVPSVDEGKQLIEQRLRNKRVLVILDDVDESEQLDALAGNLNWFGRGSRIIITTRNKHVLTSFPVPVHEVELLEKEEADQLFQFHAFHGIPGKINLEGDLIDSFIKYAGGLPLALVVLGGFLRGRSESEWKGKLKALNKSPDKTINSVLKISFDGLEDEHKEIFLDVACFFNGWDIDDVEKILDSCGFAMSLGTAILIERCLVTIDSGKIQMHDLLEAMGQKIVRDEYSKGNGIPSRIWRFEDFPTNMLSKDLSVQDRQAVKGIVLNDNWQHYYDGLVKSDAFEGFNNLRVLILRHFGLIEKRVRLPRELRWLEWQQCPASVIEFDPSSKLVGLELGGSKIRQIKGTGFAELKYLKWNVDMLLDLSKYLKLEELNLQNCQSLTSLDEAFGNLVALKYLTLWTCQELTTIPSSIYKLRALENLQLRDCRKLTRFPRKAAGAATDVLGFPNLVELAISDCKLMDLEFLNDLTCFETLKELDLSDNEFTHVPACISKFNNLEKLDLHRCENLTSLDEAFGNLVALKYLTLWDCQELATIPSSIYKLEALKKLLLGNCRKLSRFPRRAAGATTDVLGIPNLVALEMPGCKLMDLEFLNDLTCSETLKALDLFDNEFTHVPACISKFNNLESLELRYCKNLTSLDEALGDLVALKYLRLSKCLELTTIPSSIYKLRALEYLQLRGCRKLSCFPRRAAGATTDVLGLPNLVLLVLSGCKLMDLEFLNDLTCFETLVNLDLSGNEFTHVPACISKFNNLESLELRYCENQTSLDEAFGNLVALTYLGLSDCQELTTIPSSIYKLRALESLWLGNCPKLKQFPRRAAGATTDVLGIPNLVQLKISGCKLMDLGFLNDLTCFETLEVLGLSDIGFAHVPACISKFNNLESLDLSNCENLTSFDEAFGNLVALEYLTLSNCQELTTIPSSIYKLEALRHLDLRDCRKLKQFPRRVAGATTDVLGFPNLTWLDLSGCKLMDLEFLNDLTCFETLYELDLSGNEFTHVPACISKFNYLKKLKLCRCNKLEEVPELPNVSIDVSNESVSPGSDYESADECVSDTEEALSCWDLICCFNSRR